MSDIQFIKSVYHLKDLPKRKLPEIILCGRSNVGKSSFINSLFNKKGIAKTSSSPGKTRSINYYQVGEKYYMVDLPGFGYAKVSKTERDKWERLIEGFLTTEREHAIAFHFVDSRHEPTKLDVLLNDFLRRVELPYIVILTKADKLKQSEMAKAAKATVEYFPELILNENMVFYSAVKGTGKKAVQRTIEALFS